MPKRRSFLHQHSLSLTILAILGFLLVINVRADPLNTHMGAFFGNAIADWMGTLVFVVATNNSSKWAPARAAGRRSASTSGLAAFCWSIR